MTNEEKKLERINHITDIFIEFAEESEKTAALCEHNSLLHQHEQTRAETYRFVANWLKEVIRSTY